MTLTRVSASLAVLATSAGVMLAVASGSAATADEGSKAALAKQQFASLPAPAPDPELLLQNLGNETFPEIYGGMVASGDGVSYTIYLTSLDPVTETAFKVLAPTLKLTFEATNNTLANLDKMRDTLEADWDAIDAAGTQLNDFGPNAATGKLDIGVQDLKQADVDRFNAMFGAENVHIYAADPSDDADRLQASRTDDTAPYYGGDAIGNNGIGYCTSGWGVKISGNPRLLTAGHCFPVGTNVFNLKAGPVGSGRGMGSVTQSGFNSTDDLDSEVFTGCNGGTCGGTGSIWVGDPGSPSLVPVAGKAGWAVGDMVCASGVYGGSECDLKVTKDDYCANKLDENGVSHHLCHLSHTTPTDGKTTQSGDSGCPIYKKINGYAYAVGTNTSGNGVSHETFTGINAELNQFDATLLTVN